MTDLQKFTIAAVAGFLIICGVVLSYKVGNLRGYSAGYDAALNAPHKADTIWKTDTHFVDRPVEVWREREKLVYIPVKVDSLITVHDTTYVALERERKGYAGEDYEAVVSGIDPLLESIKVFPKTAYITNTVVKQKRWSFGITAGPGVVYDGSIHGGVGVVAGFGYNF